MAKYRRVKRYAQLHRRAEAGPIDCPVCKSAAKVLPFPPGAKETCLVCPQCGWYNVPTIHAPYSTVSQVMYWSYEEVKRYGAK